MRILFGPEHDGLHVDPAAPGAYEWWYFDALSDDGRYALVVIYFLGSPMSPYYKAVADGRNPDPRDWCGVFITLHEKTGDGWNERWKECAYAYNLYRGGTFAGDGSEIAVGGSRVTRGAADWHLAVNEPGLWFGRTRADLTFTVQGAPPVHPPLGEDDGHTWVCVAPVCRVEGEVNGIRFSGQGYHDHNFGKLPWANTEMWYWGRGVIPEVGSGSLRALVFYHLIATDGKEQTVAFVSQAGQIELIVSAEAGIPRQENADDRGSTFIISENHPNRKYGWLHPCAICIQRSDDLRDRVLANVTFQNLLQDGPFYRRFVGDIVASHEVRLRDQPEPEEKRSWEWCGTAYEPVRDALWILQGRGIGEVFRPARLCGPIASRAMWTRIRRRKTPNV